MCDNTAMRPICLALALALAACGHHGAPAPTPPGPAATPDAATPGSTVDAAPVPDAPLPLAQDPTALAARVVAIYEDVAAATQAGDCAAIATAVGALHDKHADDLDALHRADTAGRGPAVEQALAPYKDRIKAALDAIETRTAPCAKDAAVEHALDALFGG